MRVCYRPEASNIRVESATKPSQLLANQIPIPQAIQIEKWIHTYRNLIKRKAPKQPAAHRVNRQPGHPFHNSQIRLGRMPRRDQISYFHVPAAFVPAECDRVLRVAGHRGPVGDAFA